MKTRQVSLSSGREQRGFQYKQEYENRIRQRSRLRFSSPASTSVVAIAPPPAKSNTKMGIAVVRISTAAAAITTIAIPRTAGPSDALALMTGLPRRQLFKNDAAAAAATNP